MIGGNIYSGFSIGVVIPVKNEQQSIVRVLNGLPDYIDEIIVVDGNSSDETVKVVMSFSKVKVLSQRSKGKGAALSAGFRQIESDIVVIIDGDASMKTEEISSYLDKFPEFEIVKGSRYLENGGSDDLTLIRSVGNKALTFLANLLFRQEWTDMAYGFAAFNKNTINSLGLTDYDSQGSFRSHKTYGQGFEIETLILTRAARRKIKITEIPSYELARLSGSSNLRAIRDGVRVLIAIFVERLRDAPKQG